GYDLGHEIERLPRPGFDDFQVPALAVGFYDWVLGFDRQQQRAWLISTGLPETSAHARGTRALRRLDQVRRWLDCEPVHREWRPAERLRLQTPMVDLPGLP